MIVSPASELIASAASRSVQEPRPAGWTVAKRRFSLWASKFSRPLTPAM